MKFSILILFLFLSQAAFANKLDFKNDGKIVKSFSPNEISQEKLEKINSTEIKLYNPWRGYEKTYVGYEFFKILDSIYGEKWRKSATIKFIAQDGYTSISNIQSMIKASTGKTGLISYKEKDKSGFTLVKKGEKEIDPGPFYLVWSNFNDGDKATYGDALKWPYQLKEIDIVN